MTVISFERENRWMKNVIHPKDWIFFFFVVFVLLVNKTLLFTYSFSTENNANSRMLTKLLTNRHLAEIIGEQITNL